MKSDNKCSNYIGEVSKFNSLEQVRMRILIKETIVTKTN